jgi:hypothetical protein
MMESTSIERTPEAARAAINDAYASFAQGAAEGILKSTITKGLVDEVLGIAWRHQFDEDRSQVQRTLKELVSDRVSELEAEGRLP